MSARATESLDAVASSLDVVEGIIDQAIALEERLRTAAGLLVVAKGELAEVRAEMGKEASDGTT